MIFISLYIALILTVNAFLLWRMIGLIVLFLKKVEKRVIPSQPKEIKEVSNETLREVLGLPKKPRGSIYKPPTDIEIERERIIAERKAKGLDTPVDMLRERNDENEK